MMAATPDYTDEETGEGKMTKWWIDRKVAEIWTKL